MMRCNVLACLFLIVAGCCPVAEPSLAEESERLIAVWVSEVQDGCGKDVVPCFSYTVKRPASEYFFVQTIEIQCDQKDCGNVLYAFLVPETDFTFEFTFEEGITLADNPISIAWEACIYPPEPDSSSQPRPPAQIRGIQMVQTPSNGTMLSFEANSRLKDSCLSFDFCVPATGGGRLCDGDPTLITKTPPLP